MVPAASPSERERVGPHPSYIEIAKPYILQTRIQKCLSDVTMSDAKEDAVRLQGVAWIDTVRRALQLPIRTFNTAVIYYHKFRLLHSDNEYNWADASAAALFTACKIEDTLKKSREILCANWNMKAGAGESLSSDDPRFDNHAKLIIGLERLMLESAGFDFRNRYPQKLMVKLARALKFDHNNVSKTAWNLSIDLYKTFAPLKQNTPTLAIACLELAARLHDMDASRIVDSGPVRYSKWATSRGEVMETLLDLLDLYTHHRGSTSVGPLYTLEAFIDIRIGLNQEASAANIPRFALYSSESASDSHTSTNGAKHRNGTDPTSPITPATPSTISPSTNHAPTSAIGIRGQNGTVRFMLNAACAHNERNEVDKFHKIEEEEYEVEVPAETRLDDRDKRSRDHLNYRNPSPDWHVNDHSDAQLAGQATRGGGGSSYWDRYRQRREGATVASQDERDIEHDNASNLSYSSGGFEAVATGYGDPRRPTYDYDGMQCENSVPSSEYQSDERSPRDYGRGRKGLAHPHTRRGRGSFSRKPSRDRECRQSSAFISDDQWMEGTDCGSPMGDDYNTMSPEYGRSKRDRSMGSFDDREMAELPHNWRNRERRGKFRRDGDGYRPGRGGKLGREKQPNRREALHDETSTAPSEDYRRPHIPMRRRPSPEPREPSPRNAATSSESHGDTHQGTNAIHPDRLKLLAQQEPFQQRPSSPPPRQTRDRKVPNRDSVQPYVQRTSEPSLSNDNNDKADGPPPRSGRGLSAEDGHQWVRDMDSSGKGWGWAQGRRGRGRGRGQGRGMGWGGGERV